MKKVAIWGPNRWCNFGDDLQSVVYALHLKSLGYHPVVFMLDESIAKEHEIGSADNVKDLLSGTKVCIIAGGALLTPASPPKQLILSMRRRYALDIYQLYREAQRVDAKVCALSMGGDGKTRNRWFWYDLPRNLFFASDRFVDGTVRLEGDIAQMRNFGKNFKHYPDCLFSITKFIDLDMKDTVKSDTRIHVGFNFQKRHIPDSFLQAIVDYSENNNDICFHFATTHMDHAIEKYGINYEYLPEKENENLRIEPYKTPMQLLKFVAEMDVFIASKLHLGLLGLLVGTPFISYKGMGKARSFLKSIGADQAILSDETTFDDLVNEDGMIRQSKEKLLKMYDFDTLHKMTEDSWNHYEFCQDWVEKNI
jgi:hypothetical protein